MLKKLRLLIIPFLGISALLTIFNSFDFKLGKIFLASAATESVSVIRQDCTGYSNCYTSLSAWETAQQKDLVASNEIAVARIEGTWTNPDTAVVAIDGWTTGPDNYIKIYTAAEARHGGTWDTGKYRLSASKDWGGIIAISEEYVRIDGLQIENTGNRTKQAKGLQIRPATAATDLQISSNIIKGNNAQAGTPSQHTGIDQENNANIKFYNNIVYGWSSVAYNTGYITEGSINIYNNTLTNNAIGLRNNGSGNPVVRWINNIVQGTGTNYIRDASVDYSANNISQDSSSPNTSLQNQTVTFLDNAGENFHISSSDTVAKDAGADLSADPNLAFTADIDGETRSGSWDIGADEYAAAQSNNTPPPAPSDTTAPVRSGGSPLGALAAGTTQATLALATNENATCKYGTAANTAYSSIANTFTTTGGTSHSVSVTTQNGQSYSYHVRCIDNSGNTNTDDFPISFSVDNPPADTTQTQPSQTTAATSTANADTIKAFPGAEGFGANSLGGRGGRVIKVTNLNDSGAGSFREAVTASGKRIVVFTVSGTINLQTDILIQNPYLTIAGQTSPGGILVAGRSFVINTHDVIIQHMRFRTGVGGIKYQRDSQGNIIYYSQPQYGFPTEGNCLGTITTPQLGYPCAISGGANPETLDTFDIFGNAVPSWFPNPAHNIIIDHSSLSWGVDEVFDIGLGANNVTVQWSIVSEGLSRAGHPKGEHSKGIMVNTKYTPSPMNISFHHNFFANNVSRNPELCCGQGEATTDVVNNIVYNFKGSLSMNSVGNSSGKEKVNWVHNYVKRGPGSNSFAYEAIHEPTANLAPSPVIYTEGNVGIRRLDQSYKQWYIGESWRDILLNEGYRSLTPFATQSIKRDTMSADVASCILSAAGATAPFRDAVDTKLVQNFNNGTGAFNDGSTIIDSNKDGYIDIVHSAGFPTFNQLPLPADADNDGMADSWESGKGLDITINDANSDRDNDGYTNIEEYFHDLSAKSYTHNPTCMSGITPTLSSTNNTSNPISNPTATTSPIQTDPTATTTNPGSTSSGSTGSGSTSSSGSPASNTGVLLRDANTQRTYYIDTNETKRLITSPTVFSQNGFSWNNVTTVPGTELNKYIEGTPVTGKIATSTPAPKDIPAINPNQTAAQKAVAIPTAMKNALLVKVKNTIYAIVNNQRYAITSPSIFNAYKFSWGKIKNITLAQLNKYPRVKLVKATGSPAVYYITDRGQKKAIPSAAIFLAYGNKWSDVVEILPEDLAKYPDVKLIRLEGDTKIYLLENGVKRHIRSMDVFTRMKLNMADIVMVKKIEFDHYQTGEDAR